MASRLIPFIIPAMEGVAKGPEKKGTTENTKSTKKSFSFPLCSLCSLWFKAFMLFATIFFAGMMRSKGQGLKSFAAPPFIIQCRNVPCH